MNDKAQESAKKEILNIVEIFGETKKKQLLASLHDDFQSSDGDGKKDIPEDCPKLFLFSSKLPFWVISLLIMTIAIFVSILIPLSVKIDANLDIRTLLLLLAFVVALASYLASSGREAAKTSRSCVAPRKRKRDIFYMVSVEAAIIMLAVLTVFRFYTGSSPWPIFETDLVFCFDAFLVSSLAVILLSLACLHIRIWINTSGESD